jgi:hypothetical protein
MSSGRPQWPWLLVFVGCAATAFFGLRWYTATQVVQRVDSSDGVLFARGLNAIGGLFGFGGLGAAIDPRNQQLYASARQAQVEDFGMAVFAAIAAIVGLLILATWRPTMSPTMGSVASDSGAARSGPRVYHAHVWVHGICSVLFGGLAVALQVTFYWKEFHDGISFTLTEIGMIVMLSMLFGWLAQDSARRVQAASATIRQTTETTS